MQWSEFYLIVSGLMTLVILLVAFPWLRRRNAAKRDSVTNTRIVRQRLAELEREVREGLISEHDRRQASDELKLALVDEATEERADKRSAIPALLLGAVIALTTAGIVYYNVNQMAKVSRAVKAVDALPVLSKKLASDEAEAFSPDDIANLTLAIRQRLRTEPDDSRGWLYLGRLYMNIGQEVQAVEALERAHSISPDTEKTTTALIQALMVTGDVNNLNRAQQLLTQQQAREPDNANYALMMAVASAQLGDTENLASNFDKIKGRLNSQSDMYQQLAARLSELTGEPQEVAASDDPAIALTVSLDETLSASLPDRGFLIVFAQDALSENRMPAAVVRVPLGHFPQEIKLTTQNAMMPAYTLAQLKEVRLVARISKDEDVTPSSGDLQGEVVMSVAPGLSSNQIVINKELM